MRRAERVAADGADLFVGSTDGVLGVSAGGLVMLAHRLFTIRAVIDEVSTVGFLALNARLCMC